MKKLIYVTFMLVYATLIATRAFAQTEKFDLQYQAEEYSLILEEQETTTAHYWAWDIIRFRTVLELGINIPVIANFSVNPEVEFFFVKK